MHRILIISGKRLSGPARHTGSMEFNVLSENNEIFQETFTFTRINFETLAQLTNFWFNN